MSQTVAGTLLLPDGSPLANASIYLTAKRVEFLSIVQGVNTFFTTNSSGVYSHSIVDGWYAVAIEYLSPISGSASRRWNLGDIVITPGGTVTLNALLISANPPEDPTYETFYQILADTTAQAAAAAASAAAAAASAASISIGTGPTQIPNTTILDTRLGTTGNLGTMAQQNANAVNITGGSASGLSSLEISGSITFAGLARRFLADFSDATFSNRFSFQSSVANGSTSLGVLPNGTSTTSAFHAYNNSDPTNSSVARLSVSTTSVTLAADVRGTGTALPVVIVAGSNTVATFDISSNTSLSGNLSFTGSAKRILGDFSNAVIPTRTFLQTSTANSITSVGSIPNGTSVISNFTSHNNSDPTNCAYSQLAVDGTGVRFLSGIRGSGTLLPLSLSMNGTDALIVDTSSNTTITGNLSLTGSGRRIQSDFGNATFNSRTMFQSNVVNGNTSIGLLPNGTAVAANLIAFNAQDTTNCAYTQLSVNSTASDLVSGVRGTGTALPLIFSVGGSASQNLNVDGTVKFPRGNIYIDVPSGQSSLYMQQGGVTNGRIYAGGGAGTDVIVDAGRFAGLNGVSGSYLGFNGATKVLADSTGITATGRVAATTGMTLGNSDQAGATTLDWYEEGTFTPSAVGSTTAGTCSYSVRTGGYQRVGNRVHFQCTVVFSSHTGTGNLQISGLPYTSSGVSNRIPSITLFMAAAYTAGYIPSATISPGSSAVYLYQNPSNGSLIYLATPPSGEFTLTGSYEV